MPLISSRSLSIGDFEKFSQQSATSESAIIGKKVFGSGAKKISSFSFQSSFGGTSEVVADFKNALAQKYGEEIADFVFSDETQSKVLERGLDKKTITAVLKKAEAVNNSSLKDDFFDYQRAIASKQKIVQTRIEQLSDAALRKAKKKYTEIKKTFRDCADLFDDWHANNSATTSEALRNFFQEKLKVIDHLASEILIDNTTRILKEDLQISPEKARDSIRSLQTSLGDPLAIELMETVSSQRTSISSLNDRAREIEDIVDITRKSFATTIDESQVASKEIEDSDHTELAFHDADNDTEFKALLAQHPQLKQFLENLNFLPEILQKKIDLLSQQLKPFITPAHEASPESYFYIKNETVTLYLSHTGEESPPQAQQETAAKQFFSLLKEFYGEELIDTIVPSAQQDETLTIQKTHEVLNKIHAALQQVSQFLKDNPIIITPEYLFGLAHDKEAAAAVVGSHQNLEAEGATLIHSLREMGICGMILCGTKIGLSLAGVCTPALPCVAVALVAAAVDGYVIGHLVAREDNLPPDQQNQAATVSALSTTGSAAGLILSNILQPLVGTYVPEVALSTAAEYIGSYGALALQQAVQGGANATSTDLVFLEPRLARFFGIEHYVERLCLATNNLLGPIAESSIATESLNQTGLNEVTSS